VLNFLLRFGPGRPVNAETSMAVETPSTAPQVGA
jgi:hypothetical protein